VKEREMPMRLGAFGEDSGADGAASRGSLACKMVPDPDLERGGKTSVVASLSAAHHLGHAPRSVTAGAAGRSRKALIVRQGFGRAKAFGPLIAA
jgi:hypothetical protein